MTLTTRVMSWSLLLHDGPRDVGLTSWCSSQHLRWIKHWLPTACVENFELSEAVVARHDKSIDPPDSLFFDCFQPSRQAAAAGRRSAFDLLVVTIGRGLGTHLGLKARCTLTATWASLRDGGVGVYCLDLGPNTEADLDTIARLSRGQCWMVASPNGESIVAIAARPHPRRRLRAGGLTHRSRHLAIQGDPGFGDALQLMQMPRGVSSVAVSGVHCLCASMGAIDF